MTITQTVDIPADRWLKIKVPKEIPAGKAILAFTPIAEDKTSTINDCPLCAKYRDPETRELRFNAKTVAAIEEGDAMLRGEIPSKWYNSLEEMLVDLDTDD